MAVLLEALDLAYKGSKVKKEKCYLNGSTKRKLMDMIGVKSSFGKVQVIEGSMSAAVGFTVMCLASAGQNQKKMEHFYKEYELAANEYKLACDASREAAEGQQEAVDSGKASEMSATLLMFCTNHEVEYSTKGKDYKHDKEQWQSLRDGLDYEKSAMSTELKMVGSKFDNASKDYDSTVQGANKGIQDYTSLLSKVSS